MQFLDPVDPSKIDDSGESQSTILATANLMAASYVPTPE